MSRTQRSPEAALYRPLYKTAEWQRLRERVLVRDRYTCQRPGCGRLIVEPKQAIVHHKRPHKGDRRLFFDETNCEVVCKACHDGDVQSSERRGYSAAIGSDGWPIDEAHPANRSTMGLCCGAAISTKTPLEIVILSRVLPRGGI